MFWRREDTHTHIHSFSLISTPTHTHCHTVCYTITHTLSQNHTHSLSQTFSINKITQESEREEKIERKADRQKGSVDQTARNSAHPPING